jgi:hypothetical protein
MSAFSDPDLITELHNAGLQSIAEEALAEFDASGVWIGEFPLAHRALALVIGDREPTVDESQSAFEATQDIIGRMPLSTELEAEISAAAEKAILEFRNIAAKSSSVYLFPSGLNFLADEILCSRLGHEEDGRTIRRLPFSRVVRVINEKLGLVEDDTPDMIETIKRGIVATHLGPDAQSSFATDLKNTSWLFKNADPADFR